MEEAVEVKRRYFSPVEAGFLLLLDISRVGSENRRRRSGGVWGPGLSGKRERYYLKLLWC